MAREILRHLQHGPAYDHRGDGPGKIRQPTGWNGVPCLFIPIFLPGGTAVVLSSFFHGRIRRAG